MHGRPPEGRSEVHRNAPKLPELGDSLGRVLLVEDEPILRRLLRRALLQARVEVVEASDGIAALEHARQSEFDVVVSDVRMPNMDGLDLLRALVDADPDLPVILMSASDDVPDRSTAQRLGAFDFLRKPITLQNVVDSVLRALEWRVGRAGTVRVVQLAPRHRSAILVVDDYEDARASVREALESAGHTVVEAANGQQAMELLVSRRDFDIGLIVLDLAMPVMDGWKFLELTESYVRLSTIPVIIASANANYVNPHRHLSVVGRLQQPFDAKRLLDVVGGWVIPSRAST